MPDKPSVLERKVKALLDTPSSDEELRAGLEALATHYAFPGLAWLWGPPLYERNRLLFRPFILAHFSTFGVDDRGGWTPFRWDGDRGRRLERWLEKVESDEDVELFRLLYASKISSTRDAGRFAKDVVERFRAAGTPARRLRVLQCFDVRQELDEPGALALFEVDAEAAKPFILSHLPSGWTWKGPKRVLWVRLFEAAGRRGDEELADALYRRQAPLDRWLSDALALCDRVSDGPRLCAALEKRTPEGFGFDLGDGLCKILERRGRDVVPYALGRLRQVRGGLGWFGSGFDRLLQLAQERDWHDLWACLLRVSASSPVYNREVRALVSDRRTPDADVERRLLQLVGADRRVDLPGWSGARSLEDATACAMYERFPGLLRGPFRLQIVPNWNEAYSDLVGRVLANADAFLIDWVASRLLTHAGDWLAQVSQPLQKLNPFGERGRDQQSVEALSRYYEELRGRDGAEFARRACAVLTRVPAYSIFDYGRLVRANRLARMLFERSVASLLECPDGLRDLVEAPEIHVQLLAYRALGQDDDRARALAADTLDILQGTLLRPLHRATRLAAFGALANAATTTAKAARILARAREALDLPDRGYPKEKVVGLIGQILHRFPELRTERERPRVYGVGVGEAEVKA